MLRSLASLVLFFAALLGTPSVASEELERCVVSLLQAALYVPAEIGGRPSDLRRFVSDLRARRERLVAANRPEDRLAIERIDNWLVGFEARLDAAGTSDQPLDGYSLLGYGRLGEFRLGPNADAPTRFEKLVNATAKSPEATGLPASELAQLAREIETDRDVLAARNQTEDRILIRRVNRWLAAAAVLTAPPAPRVFRLDEGLLDDEGFVLGGDEPEPGPPLTARADAAPTALELFWEFARDSVVNELYRSVTANDELARRLQASAARRLDPRQQLLFLGDSAELQTLLRAYATKVLPSRTRLDPMQIAVRADDLNRMAEEVAFLLTALDPSQTTISVRVTEAWINVARARVASAEGPKAYLPGYAVLDVSRLGSGVRLAPAGLDITFRPPPPPLGKIEDFLTEATGSTVPREAFDPALDRLPDEFANLIAMVQADAVLGERYRTLLPPNATPREQLITLMKDESTRRLAVDVAEAILAQTAAREKSVPTRKVDILFIGAGLAEQNMQNLLRQRGGNLVTFTVERKKHVGNTFRQGMYTFGLNSTSRPEDRTSLRQMLSSTTMSGGDLNYFPGGVVQINQFDNRQNPVAASAAAAIAINRSLVKESNARLALETELVSTQLLKADDPLSEGGRYNWLATMADGSRVLARVAINTGIGVPGIPSAVTGLREAYEQAQRERLPNRPPAIMTLEDIFEWINSTENPYGPFSNAIADVAGPGDSGKAVERWLNLLSDPRAYGLDSRNISTIARSRWWGQPCDSCDTFIGANRSFYADLGRGFRSGRIQSRPRLGAVELVNGKVRSTAEGATAPEADDADFLILTLGYKSLLAKILGPTLGDTGFDGEQLVQSPDYFRLVYGFEPSLGRVPLARQLMVNGVAVPFFTIGPSSGPGVVTGPELANVEENFVANVNNSWREWRMIEAITALLGESVVPPAERPAVTRSAPRPATFEAEPGAPYPLPITADTKPSPTRANNDVLLAAEVLTVITRELSFARVPNLTITISRTAEGSYTVGFEKALAPASAEAITKAMAAYPRLTSLIVGLVGPSTRNTVAIIEFGFKADGSVNSEESSVSLRRR